MAKKYSEPLHIVELREDGVHWGVKRCNRDTGHYTWVTGGYASRSEAEEICRIRNRVTPDG
jgi:hypothetical protein